MLFGGVRNVFKFSKVAWEAVVEPSAVTEETCSTRFLNPTSTTPLEFGGYPDLGSGTIGDLFKPWVINHANNHFITLNNHIAFPPSLCAVDFERMESLWI